jgi:hypothetical protein
VEYGRVVVTGVVAVAAGAGVEMIVVPEKTVVEEVDVRAAAVVVVALARAAVGLSAASAPARSARRTATRATGRRDRR